MIEHILAYVKNIDKRYQTGQTTEHSFRGDLQQLIQNCTSFVVINEQKRIECGMPDLALYKDKIAIAFIEAKDLNDNDLDGKKKNKEQFDRYKASLDTVIFTDYLDFHLYIEGELLTQVQLASVQNGHIALNEDAVPRFVSVIEHLLMAQPQKIASPAKLAKMMADKARVMAKAVDLTLAQDTEKKGKLSNQLKAFQNVINKDLDEKRFADLYAQTIAYGLFAARLHDNTPDKFTRIEAAELIPHTNPFLRQIFQHIAGFDIEESIKWIVEDLVNIFAATDVSKLRKNFGKEMQKRDPMIHFYEDFLQAYDPAAKKRYGVYYTPQPVVEFIVRAVDDILKADFHLEKGLADISKTDVKIRKMEDGKDVPTETIESRHRVQILDPATGTGTFLAEVVGRIKERQQAGAWTKYVDEHLIPRIHGFEYMMAPYTIAHLKLDMLINWWGDQKLPATHKDRVQIYLTNSLDQTELTNKYTLAEMIAKEANEANNIKHNAPVMVMLGNPPYSVSSSNKSKWITDLLEIYKKDLNERNIQPLSDDYIKFIRLGQYYIERTGEGILAYISNNSFLDGLIHRQMRRELMRCFDDIYILDLHGNNRKKETAPDGSKDENVFSIMQGVSINIFVKKPHSEDKPATIHHYDLYGSRKSKYAFLLDNSLSSISWQILQPQAPNLFFVPKDFGSQEEYERGFKVDELMRKNVCGIQTGRDNLYIDYEKIPLGNRVRKLLTNDIDSNFIEKYKVRDSSGYNMLKRVSQSNYCELHITPELYRPFDIRYIYYDPNLIKRSFHIIMSNMKGDNFGIIISRQLSTFDFQHVLCTNLITDMCSISAQTKECSYLLPLYIYDEGSFDTERIPNLDENIWRTIENWVKFGQAFRPLTANEQSGELGFDAEPEEPHFLAPEDIFDYIYGVLHSPAYRAKYKEFLKVDFPRIPYPKNMDEFEHFRSYGNRLRELHLMHNVPESPVTFPETGTMAVEQVVFKESPSVSPELDFGTSVSLSGVQGVGPSSVSPESHSGIGRVYINSEQYFDNVPETAWNFYIGGYQPAQKWLKDRKGRTLTFDDIEHYRRIISVLMETKAIMDRID